MRNTQHFLKYSGLFLIGLTVGGFVGFGPTASASMFGNLFYLDAGENLLHLAFGIVALLAYWQMKSDRSLRILSGLFGLISLAAIVMALLNLSQPIPNLGVTQFEIADIVLHGLLAAWALWVAFMPEGPMFVRESAKPASLMN